MTEPVDWQTETVPFSQRYGDRYHTTSGARAQTEHVFLGGCGLPQAWQGQKSWTILETGFGLGLSFLTTWAAWQADPQGPHCLKFFSVEAHPVCSADIKRAAEEDPLLQPLGHQLAQKWPGILAQADAAIPATFSGVRPGERVELHLLLGNAPDVLTTWAERHGSILADSLFLDGFDPRCNPVMWSIETLQAVARHLRPGATLATWTVARQVRNALHDVGAIIHKRPGLPPKRACLAGQMHPE
ncbi:MAG: tRNA (5-methylaminomethyl-2-thiouridine)(34)-methyltransferase MnmD [Lautropia sp.]|nr:tRNA (5-methylaminomethyl-2-thiouridine)(34)-methyltransferase MnmD [Lautropia sp.]